MSFRKQIIKGMKWSTFGTIGHSVFQLLQISILTRFLPKEVFGLIALAIMVVNFTNIFVEMGFTSAIFYRQDASKKEYSSLYWLNLMISVIFYFILFLLSEPIAVFYGKVELINIIRILGLNIVLVSIGKQHKSLLMKRLEFDVVAKLDLFSYLIGLIAAILLALEGYEVYSLVYSTLLTSFIASVLLIMIRFKADPIELHFSFKDTIPFLRVGGYSLSNNILDFFSRELDIIIIGRFLGTEFLGVYSLAKQISMKAYSIMIPIIFNVFNPLLATLNKEKERMENCFLKIVYGVSNLTFPVYLCIILAASEVLTLFYGESYKEGTTTLIALAVFQACFTIVKPSGSLQIATGKTDVGLIWTIVRNVLTVLVLFITINYFQIKLIPVFLAVLSVVLVFLLWYIQIKRMSSIEFSKYFKQFIFAMLAFFVSIGFKFLFLDHLVRVDNPAVSGMTKITIGLSFYVLLIYLFDGKRILKTSGVILISKR